MCRLSKSDILNFEQTVENVFQQAIQAEYKSRFLYVQFSKMFNHVHEVSALWTSLAKDEVYHAKVLEKIQASLTIEQLSQTADQELLDNIKEVLTFLREIKLDMINTLDDVYEVAHELEFSEINSVFKILATEFISDVYRKEAVLSQLGQHTEKLITFNEKFGDKTWRKGIIAQHLTPQA